MIQLKETQLGVLFPQAGESWNAGNVCVVVHSKMFSGGYGDDIVEEVYLSVLCFSSLCLALWRTR